MPDVRFGWPAPTWRAVGAILYLLSAVLALPAAAQTPAPSLSGTVRVPAFLEGDRPEPEVVVTLQNASGTVATAVTDGDGRFEFTGLAQGTYSLRIEMPQFAAFRQDVTIGATPTPPLVIKLQFKSPDNTPDFVAVRDRWRIRFPEWQRYPADVPGEFPYVKGRGVDPYDQNVLKGDLPIRGQSLFLILSATAEAPLEFRKLPTPSGVSTEDPDSEAFFGEPEQFAALPSGIFTLEVFHGDAAFRPKDWALRVTPVFNVNYVTSRERNGLNISPEKESTRRRDDFALQEAFGEVKLFDVGSNFDFVSVRAGIQPFTSDFRGFLFRDNNLGVRLFGTWGRTRNQWNLAFFDQLEKETNSELNLFERRNQRVVVANYFRQDFLTPGYTISPSFHASFDEGDESFFDANGFLVRPAPIGLVNPHRLQTYYAGLAGDGHWGRLNLTHQFYQALGHDDFNGIASQPIDINAQFAAVELSFDRDWLRPKAAFVWSSGDSDPDDDRGRGFDAILDSPNIIGGAFSFWNRQGLRLASTGVSLVGRSSVIPSLRSSKTEGQASFVNPGVFIYNAGLDAELTTKLKASVNVSYLRFQDTTTLRRVLFQDTVRKDIGFDYSAGAQYRPFLNDNVIVTAGMSVFTPGGGFKDILTSGVLYSPFVLFTVSY